MSAGVGPGTRVALQNVTQNFTAPLSALGAFIGGGGYIFEEDVNSGTTNMTTQGSTIVLWNSASTAVKTNYIPVSSGSMQLITICDIAGTAYAYPITAVPLTGSIINGQNQVYTNLGSITLLDSSQGWVGI